MDPALRGQTADGLDRRIVEAIAGQVVALIREELGLQLPAEEWVDAREIARRFGLSRAWVYAHARQLGAVRLGSGPRARMRFDPHLVAVGLRAIRVGADEAPTADSAIGVRVHVPRVLPRGPRSSPKEH
jgi:hypothetical protein